MEEIKKDVPKEAEKEAASNVTETEEGQAEVPKKAKAEKPKVEAPKVRGEVQKPKPPVPAAKAVPEKPVDPLTLLQMKFDALCKMHGVTFKYDAGRIIAIK